MADKETKETKAAAPEVDENETKTYYLKPGMRHNTILKGELVELSKEGDEVELTDAQYKSFGDKFFTEDQWTLARKESIEAAEAAAKENQPPSEPANPEDAQTPKPQGATGTSPASSTPATPAATGAGGSAQTK